MNRKFWTSEERELLIENYPDWDTREVAAWLGRSVSSVYHTARNLGLKKEQEFKSSTKREIVLNPRHGFCKNSFKKGQISHNKGRKQIEYMSPESMEKCRKTWFKKGNIPGNHRPVGSERILSTGYVDVKISDPNTWKLKHRLVWEQHNGVAPKGANIQFRDGNKQNCHIDNLYLITREEQLKTENSMYARYPKEVQLAIQAKGALNRQINKINQKSQQ